MRYCLSQHPNVYIGPESNFFQAIYGSRTVVPDSLIKSNSGLILEMLFASGDPSMSEFEPNKDAIEKSIKMQANNYRELSRIIFSSFAIYKQKPRWGEKTPLHLYYLDKLFDYFPNARVICMRRDPKNIIASYIKSSHMPNRLSFAMAEVRHCWKIMQRITDKRLQIVEYEDLLANPSATLRMVCDFLDEEFKEAMLNPKMRDSSYSGGIMEFDESIKIEQEPGANEKWKRVLSEEEARSVMTWVNVGAISLFSPEVSWLLIGRAIIASWVYRMRLMKSRMGLFHWKRVVQVSRRRADYPQAD